LEKELLIDELQKTVKSLGRETEINIRHHQGYDHSFFFISTFIADHINHHATILKE
jgi:S-formylglutathione hydrolase